MKNPKVNRMNEFIVGIRKALDVVIEREDRDKWTLLHFIDKQTGAEVLPSKWVRKDNICGKLPEDGSERVGGEEPYVMLFYRRVNKVFKENPVGGMDCQLSTLVILSQFIQMNTGKLVNKRTKEAMTRKEIARELGISVRRAAGILSDLKANGLIVRKDNAYVVPREFIAKGRTPRRK